MSALYVPSQRITPSLLALSSFFELRDLTLLSLSPKSCGRELHSQLCPHIMVCMDVRSKLPNTNKCQGLMPPAAAPPRRLAARAVPQGARAIPIAET